MNLLLNIKQVLFTNWNFVRWLRLGLGLFIAFQALESHDSLAGLIATFFLFQAMTNTGCCGASGCAVRDTSSNSGSAEVTYEEIKPTKNEN